MSCDHEHLSPKGTVVLSSFEIHDGLRYWYSSCCRCGKTVSRGASSITELRMAVAEGTTLRLDGKQETATRQ